MEEPGGLQSTGSQLVGHDLATNPPPPKDEWHHSQRYQPLFPSGLPQITRAGLCEELIRGKGDTMPSLSVVIPEMIRLRWCGASRGEGSGERRAAQTTVIMKTTCLLAAKPPPGRCERLLKAGLRDSQLSGYS